MFSISLWSKEPFLVSSRKPPLVLIDQNSITVLSCRPIVSKVGPATINNKAYVLRLQIKAAPSLTAKDKSLIKFGLCYAKITADSDCSMKIKRCLLFGRKALTNLDSVLKSRDIILPTKVHLVKAMVFLVVMYWCESWIIKKTECQRIDAFELWCWRRLLRFPWTAGRSNQSVLKEINPDYSLEGLMQKLKLQYFGHLTQELTAWERPWCWERLKAGERGDREWDGWMASPTQWTWVWANSGKEWMTGKSGMLQSMGLQRVRHDLVSEQQMLARSSKAVIVGEGGVEIDCHICHSLYWEETSSRDGEVKNRRERHWKGGSQDLGAAVSLGQNGLSPLRREKFRQTRGLWEKKDASNF